MGNNGLIPPRHSRLPSQSPLVTKNVTSNVPFAVTNSIPESAYIPSITLSFRRNPWPAQPERACPAPGPPNGLGRAGKALGRPEPEPKRIYRPRKWSSHGNERLFSWQFHFRGRKFLLFCKDCTRNSLRQIFRQAENWSPFGAALKFQKLFSTRSR